MMSHVGSSGLESQAEFEIALRRWLEAEPGSALEIIKSAKEKKWPTFDGRMEQPLAGPSIELLMIWAKSDLPSMIRWAESLDIRKDDHASIAQGMLLSRVDTDTCNRWLANATSAKEEDNRTAVLLSAWAGWDPKAALDAAVATKNAQTIEDVVAGAVFGPWAPGTFNTRRFALETIEGFDIARLSEDIRNSIKGHWSQFVMEAWGDIDVSAAARHGFNFMLITDYAPRENLIKFFSGHDEYPDEGGMIDRTFCALRVWAVVKSREMKAWIATIKEADMRKALTWLLEHPWGTGPTPKE